jgi:hypothetical protein
MNIEKLAGEDLVTLIKERGNICISVIVPTHRLSSERQVDKFEVEKLVSHAKLMLQNKYPESESKSLIAALDAAVQTVDYNHNEEGLGIFISKNVQQVLRFPFPVQEKVMVGDNFEIRDVVYMTRHKVPYYALMLSEKRIRLFYGQDNGLTEIKGDSFPFEYREKYEYNTPSRGSSSALNSQMRSFEHDKSTLEQVRIRDFFRVADDFLADYLVPGSLLVLMGAEKSLSLFEQATDHKKYIIAKIQGNYEHHSVADLQRMVYESIGNYKRKEWADAVTSFRERVGEGLGVTGIQDIWTVVQEGRGRTLLVEKDFKMPGFVEHNNGHFLALRPTGGSHETMPDAVDELIEKVLTTGGEVIFTDNDALADYNGMALITRY